MSALCNPTLPLGLGDDEFSDDLQALMPGSPFDLLLGTSGGALLDLSKSDEGLAQKLPDRPIDQGQEHSIRRQKRQNTQAARQWDPFPSTLLEGSGQYRRAPAVPSESQMLDGQQLTGGFSDLVPLSATSTSSLPNLQPLAWPESMHCSLAPVISLPESFDRLNGKGRQNANQGDVRRSFESRPLSMPAKSQSGETSDDQFAAAAAALDVTNQNGVELNGHSKSVDRSSSLQHGGIFKRNRFKPRKRAQTAQVAELSQQVADLKARCSSMERELSHRSALQGEIRADELGSLSQALPLSSRSPSGAETRTQPTPPPSTPSPQSGQEDGNIGELGADVLQQMSYQTFETLYKSQVSSIAIMLGSLPQSKNQRAMDDLMQKSCDVLLFVMRNCMENSVVVKTWMTESYQAEQSRLETESNAESIWTTTAASLELSSNQKQAVLHLRQAFLERLTSLKTSRETIAKGLTGSLPSTFRNRMSAAASLGAMRKIEAYVANIKACDRLICDFVSSLLTQIFTPVQMARCIVATYPYWPDMLALSTYIAASEGEASAIGLLDEELAAISLGRSSS